MLVTALVVSATAANLGFEGVSVPVFVAVSVEDQTMPVIRLLEPAIAAPLVSLQQVVTRVSECTVPNKSLLFLYCIMLI